LSGGVQIGWGGETSYFLALCVNISKTVRDTSKVSKLLLMTNRKLHALSIGTKVDVDDLDFPELL